jgi:hypothetical protein
MKIFQAYYADEQQTHLLPNTIPLNTLHINKGKQEYDIFKYLRSEGDFGCISWKFKRKAQIEHWEEKVRDKLQTWDAVIINPFPAVSAANLNCWQHYNDLKEVVKDYLDVNEFQKNIAFCSYIFAKKDWWDRYFVFMEKFIDLPKMADPFSYISNPKATKAPFVIERLVNYLPEGTYFWEHDLGYHVKKYGTDKFLQLQNARYSFSSWNNKFSEFTLDNLSQDLYKDDAR